MSESKGRDGAPVRESRSFEVGIHVIRVTKIGVGRWLASVDETPCGSTFVSSADAWEAGVRVADRMDERDGLGTSGCCNV